MSANVRRFALRAAAASLALMLVACGGEEDDGFAWKRVESGTTSSLKAVAMDGTNAWAVGAGGTVLRWDGSEWSQTPVPTTKELKRVRVAPDGHVWAFGDGIALHFDRTTWKALEPVGTNKHLKDVLPLSGTLAFGVSADADGTSIWKWEGAEWKAYAGNASKPLSLGHIWGTANEMWMVEDSDRGYEDPPEGARVVRHVDQASFPGASVADLTSSDGWLGITGGSDGVPWLLGKGFISSGISKIYRRDGDGWKKLEELPPGTLQDVFVLDGGKAFGVTDQGGVYEFDGAIWREHLPRDFSAATLRAIAGSSAADVWAVGDDGVILKLK